MNLRTSKVLAITFFSGFIFSMFVVAQALAQTPSDVFLRDLRQGDRGTDVQNLQKTLNQSPETQVVQSGPGAPGEETDYFGPLTHAAVIKFQEKYSTEILFPIDLAKGTGFVGPMTRKKLNERAGEAGITTGSGTGQFFGTTGPSSDTGSSVGAASDTTVSRPKIVSITPTVIQNGDEVTITGEGFTDDNTIRTTIGTYEHISSFDGKTLKVTLYSESLALIANPPNAPPGEVFDLTQEEAASDIPAGSQNISVIPQGFAAQLTIPVAIFIENKNGKSEQKEIEVHPANNSISKKEETIIARVLQRAETLIRLAQTPTAYARSRFNWYAWALGIATGMWAGFINQGTSLTSTAKGSPAAYPNFGGRVVMIFTCTCPIPGLAYFIYPAGGIPGPYGVTFAEYGTVVKQWYSIFPGNNVLGKSYGTGTGTCGIGILAWCFQFPVARTQIVGTSGAPS